MSTQNASSRCSSPRAALARTMRRFVTGGSLLISLALGVSVAIAAPRRELPPGILVFTPRSQQALEALFTFVPPSPLAPLRTSGITVDDAEATFRLTWRNRPLGEATLRLRRVCSLMDRPLSGPFCLRLRLKPPLPLPHQTLEATLLQRIRGRQTHLRASLARVQGPPRPNAPSRGARSAPDHASWSWPFTAFPLLVLLVVAALLPATVPPASAVPAPPPRDRWFWLLPLAYALVAVGGHLWGLWPIPEQTPNPSPILADLLRLGHFVGLSPRAGIAGLGLLAGTASVWLAHRFGAALGGRTAGLLAAAVLATHPWHLVAPADPTGRPLLTAAGLLAAGWLLQASRGGSLPWRGLWLTLGGLGLITPEALGLAVSLAIGVLGAGSASPGSATSRRGAWLGLAAVSLGGLTMLLAAIAGGLAGLPPLSHRGGLMPELIPQVLLPFVGAALLALLPAQGTTAPPAGDLPSLRRAVLAGATLALFAGALCSPARGWAVPWLGLLAVYIGALLTSRGRYHPRLAIFLALATLALEWLGLGWDG